MAGVTIYVGIVIHTNASVELSRGVGKEAVYTPDVTTFTPMVLRHFHSPSGNNGAGWIDPTAYVMSKYNNFVFRGAVQSLQWKNNLTELMDPGVQVEQTVPATQTVRTTVYRTDLRWFAGAAAIEVLTILLILPMYWGWWDLGVNLTLSPFSLALAFDSPLLKGVNSAAGPRGVVREVGDMRIKFGVVPTGHTDETGEEDGFASGRLGIGEVENVVRPRRGMKFRE